MRRDTRHRSIPVGAIGFVLLFGTACGADRTGSPAASAIQSAAPSVQASGSESVPPSPSDAPSSQAPSAAESAEPTDNLGPFGTAFPLEGTGTTDRAQITDVRVGTHAGYDRVVFEFANGIPPFRLSEASPPFVQDASGLPLEVEGDYFWELRLDGGTKVSPEGGVTYDGPTEFTPSFDALVHLVEAGDFEAISTWYIGMSEETSVRILTLTGPPRLVVDIEH